MVRMFNRRAVEEITSWYNRNQRKPLVIRGARQVGKNTAVRLAAEKLSVEIIEINLERHIGFKPLFRNYKLDELLFNFSLMSGKTFSRESTAVLFLDEAQATPSAYSCLRYFWEDMPGLAVILTGSLLDQVRRYTLTGGTPYCIQTAIETHCNHSDIIKYQTELLQAYKDDFSKYTGSQTTLKLNAFFNGIISQVGQQFSNKQANEIALNTSGNNRQLNDALERFLETRLFYRVVHSGSETDCKSEHAAKTVQAHQYSLLYGQSN